MVLPRLIKGRAMLTTIVSAINALKQVFLISNKKKTASQTAADVYPRGVDP
jgi:hypothetical protein